MRIPNNVVPLIYNTVKLINDRIITGKAGIDLLVEQGRINANSARDFIHIRRGMVNGKLFTRNCSAYIAEYFLLRIKEEHSQDGLKQALMALKLHIEYYSAIRGTQLNKLKAIYTAYSSEIDQSVLTDEEEQDAIITQQKLQKWTREQLIDKLKQLKPKSLNKLNINGKRFNRDNYIIAILKILHDFKCQICETSILKVDGSFYIEAAHIIPKRYGGEESPNNILILCPNHHKEFDYGKLEKLRKKGERVTFKLNGRLFDIPLIEYD